MNRVKSTLALLSALLLSVASFAMPTVDEANAKYSAAVDLINNKQYAQAIPVLEEAIKIGLDAGPDAMETVQNAQKALPALYMRKGISEASTSKFDQAITDLNKAADLGELYGDIATKNKAAAMLSKVYTVAGGSAFNNKEYAKAVEIFAKGYAANPNDTDLALLLAKSYAESGDLTKAAEVYTNIINLEKTHSKYAEPAKKAKDELTTYMLIAASEAAKANNTDDVTKFTDVIIAFDPTNTTANTIRLQAANNAKNYDAIIGYADAAIAAAEVAAEPDKSNMYFLIGAAFQNKENKAKAIELYKKVLSGPNVATAKAQITALSK